MSACQHRQPSQTSQASQAGQARQSSQTGLASQERQASPGFLSFLTAPLASWGLAGSRDSLTGAGAGQVLAQVPHQAREQARGQASRQRGRQQGEAGQAKAARAARAAGISPAGQDSPETCVFTGAPGVAQSLATLKEALRASQKACLAVSCLSLVLGLGCAALLLARPAPVYFGMSEDMKLLPMVPLDRPVMGDAAVKAWVAESVTLAMNLDYLNFASQLNQARGRFTRAAFAKFAASLDKEGHLPLLRQQRALMHSVVQGTPLLVRSGLVRGRLVQEFELPLLVSYETSKGRISSNQVAVVCQVQRVPVADYPRGLAISSLVTLQRRARE